MLSDIVRATVRMAVKETDEAWAELMVSGRTNEEDIYKIAATEVAYKSQEIMNSGVHFDFGNQNDPSEIMSVETPDDLIRHLNIMGVRLPYPRMSLSFWLDIHEKSEEVARNISKDTKINIEKIRHFLNPNGHEYLHLCILIDSIMEDLAFGCIWFTHFDPDQLERWGYTSHCGLISFYKDFKDREIPPPEVFEQKGLSFLNAYRNQIITANSNVVSIPITSPRVQRSSFTGSDEEYERFGKTDRTHLLYVSELFRFLLVMNTKGVEVSNVVPNIKRNKTRKKQGKYPLLAYKVLRVQKSIIGKLALPTEQGSKKRIHTCRGHIKIYTIEKPLLGHTSGPVWVRPHIRGKAKGIIIKDYDVSEMEKE